MLKKIDDTNTILYEKMMRRTGKKKRRAWRTFSSFLIPPEEKLHFPETIFVFKMIIITIIIIILAYFLANFRGDFPFFFIFWTSSLLSNFQKQRIRCNAQSERIEGGKKDHVKRGGTKW